MEESLFMDNVRTFFVGLDRMIYGLISIFYNTITDLSSIQVIDGDTINGLTIKVYTLLGLFMIFKISFSLITYIVDPDKLSDKAKGGGALIKNIIITFALIITVPFGFDLLYEAQSAILSDQIIPKFIFSDNNDTTNFNSIKTGTMYTINLDPEVCGNDMAMTTNMGDYIGLAIFNPFFVKDESDNVKTKLSGMGEMRNWYCNGGEQGKSSVSSLLSESDLYNAPKGWSTKYNYTINYSILLSSIIGIVVALLFLGFCFDIAVRMLKLLFLEIIAPVPIISYIDPDSSKNGMFKKWLKEVFSTWASLFIRLLAVFLAVLMIQKISQATNSLDGFSHPTWLRILIILGVLIFAKQLPKLLENVLGIKLGDNFTLRPLKKLGKEAAGLTAATGVAGGTLAAGLGAIDAIKNGNGFRDIASNISKGYAGGKKNPIRGLTSGMTYSNQFHTDNAKARKSMNDSDKLINKGKELFDQTKKIDSNGDYIYKDDGTFDRDESTIFQDGTYRESFQQVEAAKKAVKESSKDEQLALANYQAEITRNGRDSEKAKDLEKEWNAATARSKGAQGNLEYIKERHSNLQKMSVYKKDTERENSLNAYKKTHADAMRPESESPSATNSEPSNTAGERTTSKQFEGYTSQYYDDQMTEANTVGDSAVETNYGSTPEAQKDTEVYDMDMFGDILSQPTMVNGVPYVNGKPVNKKNK